MKQEIFLSYGGILKVVRVGGELSFNNSSNAGVGLANECENRQPRRL